MKKNIIGSLVLTLAFGLTLLGCGSLRTESINQRDDVRLVEEGSNSDQHMVRNENYTTRDIAYTGFYQSQVDAQKKAFETLSEDAKAAENGKKYRGEVGTPYVQYDVKYDVYLNNILVASWPVAAKSSPSPRYLPLGDYMVYGYVNRRGSWVLEKSWPIKVTNLPVHSDVYHFSLTAFGG
ncbi:MAG: hypothetical protein V1765_03585 [bacterium]